jgi:PAS domain S-box-containing protein
MTMVPVSCSPLILATAVGCLAALAGWAYALKRRLRTQTEFILRQLQTEVVLEKRYHDLFENAHDVVYTHDLAGNLTSFNKAAEKLTGYTRGETRSMNILDLVEPAGRTSLRRWLDHLAGGGATGTIELQLVARDGHHSILEVNARLIHQGGKPVEVEAIGRDVTDRKRVESELERARLGAEAGARMKDQFLANMSHEIRTPLNGVIGLTALLLDTPLADDQREYLEMVKSSADSLMILINDILDFSKIEAGKFRLDPIRFQFRPYLEEAIRLMRIRAVQKGIEVGVEVAAAVPAELVGDTGRLRQVLVNLLGNAVKFTQRGSVKLAVRVEGADASSTLLHFLVEDTGIGIVPEKQQMIFEAFSQADGSTTRHYGGTGLGLAICSQLVTLMGGRIWVESEPGQGSRFHFTARFGLPAAEPATSGLGEEAAAGAAAPQSERPPGEKLRILLAEDNAVNQHLVKGVLERNGHSVRAVWNGAEALEAIERERFDLVLMDVQMPQLDGLEATRLLRQREAVRNGRRIPVVAMTAHALKGDRERCLAAGMDDYISKPIRPADLLKIVTTAAQ